MNTVETLLSLEQKHLKLMQENNWKETTESLALATEYKQLNKGILRCGECEANATITCQYH